MKKLYSTNCPNCNRLKRLLEDKHIDFEVIDDISIMQKMGIMTVPILEMEDSEMKNFPNAMKWVLQQ